MSRKGFNFYRSYFDVAMELPDKDRLAFYDALAKRQFLGEEPTLTGMAKLAYISQKYVIDAQIKGWEDKTGLSLKDVENQSNNTTCQGGCQGGSNGGCIDPSVQEKGKGEVIEKEKEEEEVKDNKIGCKKIDAKASTLARKDDFYNSLIPYLSQYGKDMIRDFFDYWSEQNKSGTQMRFEKQPTWEVSKRLATWNKRETFKNQNNGYTKIQSAGSREAKEQSRRNLDDLANKILGIDESEDNGRSFR